MSRNLVIERLGEHGVIPVLRLPAPDLALRAVDLLAVAGFTTFEITMSIPEATKVIRQLTEQRTSLVGAGTVLSLEQAEECLEAGVDYLVTPCLVDGVVEACAGSDTACIVGALTPSEVLEAMNRGAAAIKIFPAASAGGPSHLRALKSIFPDTRLIPTGGVNVGNLASYLQAGAYCVGVGSDLLSAADLSSEGDTDAVATRASEYLAEFERAKLTAGEVS